MHSRRARHVLECQREVERDDRVPSAKVELSDAECSDTDIAKIVGGNALRVPKETRAR